MTKGQSDALETFFNTVSLSLEVYGGRLFAREAAIGGPDRQSIELNCEVGGSWLFGNEVVIGSDKHPVPPIFDDVTDEGEAVQEEEGWRLSTIPTVLSLYETDEESLKDSAEKNGGVPVVGRLEYHKAIQTDDGVVNEKYPKVHAWVAIGPDTFRLVRDRLLDFKKYDFSLGLDVVFPVGSVDHGWVGRKTNWDGEGSLAITGTTIVWKREHWNPDVRRLHKIVPSTPKVELPYDPTQEHVELLAGSKRIEEAVSRLLTPLWVLAATVISYVVFRH